MPSSAVYKMQVKKGGTYRGMKVHPKVSGKYRDANSVYVKVAGIWRLSYSYFTWYYYWETGNWSGCACVGCTNTRPVWCKLNPEGTVVSDSYCSSAGTKPATTDSCNCNCACACCCC